MNGKRIKKKTSKVFLKDIFAQLKSLKVDQKEIGLERQKNYSGKTKNYQPFNLISLVNLKLIQELGQKIKNQNEKSDFIIMDSFQFHSESVPPIQFASNWLKALSKYTGFGYIPVYKNLNHSKGQGENPIWRYDSHFNETGNQILANVMFDYLDPILH
jgi:hypothetical protein